MEENRMQAFIDNQSHLRNRLVDVIKFNSKAQNKIAVDIGISPTTLNHFLNGKKNIFFVSLSKIEKYVVQQESKMKGNNE